MFIVKQFEHLMDYIFTSDQWTNAATRLEAYLAHMEQAYSKLLVAVKITNINKFIIFLSF